MLAQQRMQFRAENQTECRQDRRTWLAGDEKLTRASYAALDVVLDEHVSGKVFGSQKGIHVFEIRGLNFSIGKNAGAEARLELLCNIKEDVEKCRAGPVQFPLDESKIV